MSKNIWAGIYTRLWWREQGKAMKLFALNKWWSFKNKFFRSFWG